MTFWRDWLTEKTLATLGLNERQKKAIAHTKASGQITNSTYQQMFNVAKPTASRDLEDLFKKKILRKVGTTGKGTYYTLSSKGHIKGSRLSSRPKITCRNK